jgi:type III restriction enzyme
MLISLRTDHNLEQIWKDNEYVIWGLPFYNEQLKKNDFERSIDELLAQ